jgi:hypothetical protein
MFWKITEKRVSRKWFEKLLKTGLTKMVWKITEKRFSRKWFEKLLKNGSHENGLKNYWKTGLTKIPASSKQRILSC